MYVDRAAFNTGSKKVNYIIKSEEMPWQPKFFPHEELQYGEFKPLWQKHGMDQIEVRITRIPPNGTNTKYHMHTKEEEWFFVLSGSCHINIEGEWHLIESMDSIYKPPGDYHIFRNFGDQHCDIIMLGTNVEGSQVNRLDEPNPPSDMI